MPLADANGPVSIPDITRTIKSESAHRINKALGRSGRVWQDESFDHVLRCAESLGKKVGYVLENPGRPGLAEYPVCYRWPSLVHCGVGLDAIRVSVSHVAPDTETTR